MKFTLQIDCDNDAFAPVRDDASEFERYDAAAIGVRDILRRLANETGADMAEERRGFLRDSNGNRCGQWSLHESDASQAPSFAPEDLAALARALKLAIQTTTSNKDAVKWARLMEALPKP